MRLFSLIPLSRSVGQVSSKGGACRSAVRILSDGEPERTFASVGVQTETTALTDNCFLVKIREKFQDIQLSENDKSLYKDVKIKATEEKYTFQKYGLLRVILESGKEVVIKIGEGKEEILFYYKEGKTEWKSSDWPVTEFTSTNPCLEISDVQNATVHLILDEKDSELVDFAEKAVCEGILGRRITNATLTITLENRRRIIIIHGTGSLKLNVKYVDGKPVCRWENRNGVVSFFTSVSARLPSSAVFINFFNKVIPVCIEVVRLYYLVFPRVEGPQAAEMIPA